MQRGDFLCQLGAVSTSPRAWHGTHDLSSAFLTAVGYVIDLATRNKDADFHERFASGALRRMGLKA
jgi:phage head maturation protease